MSDDAVEPSPKAFEVLYRDTDKKNEVINCDRVTFSGDWVTFTSGDYLHVAYPSRIIHAVLEVDPEPARGWLPVDPRS